MKIFLMVHEISLFLALIAGVYILFKESKIIRRVHYISGLLVTHVHARIALAVVALVKLVVLIKLPTAKKGEIVLLISVFLIPISIISAVKLGKRIFN